MSASSIGSPVSVTVQPARGESSQVMRPVDQASSTTPAALSSPEVSTSKRVRALP